MPGLDGVRGMAIILVMLHHFIPLDHTPTGWWKIFELIRSTSWCGVDAFFVLSGFLITGILFDSKEKPSYFKGFFARRALRIFPLQYAMLIAVLVVLAAIKPVNFMGVAHQPAWLWLQGANIPMAAHGAWQFGRLDHFWSLAIEEQFYLVWPFVVFFCSRKALIRICVFCIVAALVIRCAMAANGANWISIYVFTPARMDGLTYGGLLALLMRSPGGWRAHAANATCIAIVAALALATMFVALGGLSDEHVAAYTVGFTLLVLVFGAIVMLASHEETLVGRFFNQRWLRFFGTYSYGLYIFNLPVDGLLKFSRVFDLTHVKSYGVAMGINVMVGFALTIALAVPCFHLFEKQFLKLKRYFH